MNIAVTFESLSFSYNKAEVLKSVSGEIEGGLITGLFGPNGSGKTTLLKCITGLLKGQEGEISIFGKPLKGLSPNEISRLVSYVPQEHSISFPFTVREMVLMGRTPHLGGVFGPRVADFKYAADAMERIGIEDIKNQAYTELSGGQRQMALIARALAQDTRIIILDEPTSALDFKNQLNVWKIMRKLREDGKTIIVCTHDPNHVMWFCDQVIVLKSGEILSKGKTEDILSEGVLKSLYGDVCMIESGVVRPNP